MAMTTTSDKSKVEKFYAKPEFDTDVKDYYTQVKATAEKEDEIMPVLFVKMAHNWPPKPDEKGRMWEMAVVGLAGGFGDYEQKIKTFTAMGIKFGEARKMVVATFFGSEAWMGSGDEKDETGETIMPSQQKNRQECLIMFGMSIDGMQSMISAPILRKDNVKFVGKETVFDDKGQENNLLKAFYKGYAMGAFSPKKEEL
jgi:hypothetical protein